MEETYKRFVKLCKALIAEKEYPYGKIAKETGLSQTAVYSMCTEIYSPEHKIRSSTLAAMQDYLKRYSDFFLYIKPEETTVKEKPVIVVKEKLSPKIKERDLVVSGYKKTKWVDGEINKKDKIMYKENVKPNLNQDGQESYTSGTALQNISAGDPVQIVNTPSGTNRLPIPQEQLLTTYNKKELTGVNQYTLESLLEEIQRRLPKNSSITISN